MLTLKARNGQQVLVHGINSLSDIHPRKKVRVLIRNSNESPWRSTHSPFLWWRLKEILSLGLTEDGGHFGTTVEYKIEVLESSLDEETSEKLKGLSRKKRGVDSQRKRVIEEKLSLEEPWQ